MAYEVGDVSTNKRAQASARHRARMQIDGRSEAQIGARRLLSGERAPERLADQTEALNQVEEKHPPLG
jgi:hypothetical protein